jgi:hypothetical protein
MLKSESIYSLGRVIRNKISLFVALWQVKGQRSDIMRLKVNQMFLCYLASRSRPITFFQAVGSSNQVISSSSPCPIRFFQAGRSANRVYGVFKLSMKSRFNSDMCLLFFETCSFPRLKGA